MIQGIKMRNQEHFAITKYLHYTWSTTVLLENVSGQIANCAKNGCLKSSIKEDF